ncbi:hypothetical protein CG002_02750 [Mesoplasma florum]|uniref:hypothetical protein n=1 Tax=Mesoplasma florum TaxID=2151 RepID=UPI000D026531|nr:hypothetical protein [Mesoplasma florum]AVN59142.1 hypothetical protein CG009_02885 [Mesoplasma florum]AVN65256.1 hypothetical protein CG002_02750 [Mesoplasma florum]
MINRLDTVFWAYFDEYIKKDSSLIFKKINNDLKEKINEIYDVTYYSLFQFQLWKNESLINIEPEKFSEISNYIISNYNELFIFTFQDKKIESKFKEIDETQKIFIKQVIEEFVLNHIIKTSFNSSDDISQNYYWNFANLCALTSKFEYDINFKNEKESKYYYSIVYPFLVTMLMIDVLKPSDMVDKIKKVFNRKNISEAYKKGRELTSEEKEWLEPTIQFLKNEDELNAFILNFKKDNWEKIDVKQKFKIIHELSKITTIFLRDNLKNISVISEGDDVYEAIYTYLPLFLSSNKEQGKINIKTFEGPLKNVHSISPINQKDFNPIWTLKHSKKFKEFKKIKFRSEKLFDFIARVRYSTYYMEIINKTKRNNGVLGDCLISFKKVGIVQTMHFYNQIEEKFDFNYKNVKFKSINLDAKNFSKMLNKVDRFEEIADYNSQMSIMLKIISLTITIDPKAPKAFDYSWENLIKYYIIAFGPYKKSMMSFTNKDLELIEFKINKLLTQYKKLQQKDKVVDSIGVLYKLHHFK